MDTYSYKDQYGDTLRITEADTRGAVITANPGVLISREDAPTVAAELLKAAGHDDLAAHIESVRDAKADAEAEKKLQLRRDALAQFARLSNRATYDECSGSTQRAIDRIIELENEQAA